jgi:hypothetical protein
MMLSNTAPSPLQSGDIRRHVTVAGSTKPAETLVFPVLSDIPHEARCPQHLRRYVRYDANTTVTRVRSGCLVRELNGGSG